MHLITDKSNRIIKTHIIGIKILSSQFLLVTAQGVVMTLEIGEAKGAYLQLQYDAVLKKSFEVDT